MDGHASWCTATCPFYLSRAGETVDFVVERDGERLELNDVHIPYQERTDEEGNYTRLRGISIGYEVDPPTVGISCSTPGTPPWTMCGWSGSAWGTWSPGRWACGTCPARWASWTPCPRWAAPSPTAADAAYNMLTLAALIAVNLAVMNLLPIPALDGGRVLFPGAQRSLTALFRKKIAAKYEGYVHFVGLAALLTLSLMVLSATWGSMLRAAFETQWVNGRFSMTKQIMVGGVPVGGAPRSPSSP